MEYFGLSGMYGEKLLSPRERRCALEHAKAGPRP
jgi:hypothetical protein